MPSAQSKKFNNTTAAFEDKIIVSTEFDKSHIDSNKTIGKIFQAIRKQKKLDINEVAEILNISPRFIKAIESMDISQLPEKVYTLGFVRSYAKYLDINSQKSVDEFRNTFYDNKVSLFEGHKPNLFQTNLPSRKTLLFASIMSVIIAVGWLIYRKTNSISYSTVSIERPMSISNKVESFKTNFVDQDSVDHALTKRNAQKMSKIDHQTSRSHYHDIIEKPVIRSSIITQNHSDSQQPILISSKGEPHSARLPENSQLNSMEVEKLALLESEKVAESLEKVSEDEIINFDSLPRADVISSSN